MVMRGSVWLTTKSPNSARLSQGRKSITTARRAAVASEAAEPKVVAPMVGSALPQRAARLIQDGARTRVGVGSVLGGTPERRG